VNLRKLQGFLRRHRRIGIDTSPFIYHVENHPTYSAASDHVFRWLLTEGSVGITSTLTMTEVLVLPYREARADAAESVFSRLIQMGNIEWISPSLGIADRAARARAVHGLRTLDAIQLATALTGLATGFVTNDKAFSRVTDLEVLRLDQIV
jgi:predicted nucleic acid-binding protein